MEVTDVAFGRGESLSSSQYAEMLEAKHLRQTRTQSRRGKGESALQKKEAMQFRLAQEKYTSSLHDPYKLSTGGASAMNSFQCTDGSSMAFLVIGTPDVDLKHVCFVVVHDFFDTYESVQVLFRHIVANHIGTQVLLLNVPGQAYSKLPTEQESDLVLNNDYMAARINELLQSLERSGDFFSGTRPFHLVGFGNGGNIATYFASKYNVEQADAQKAKPYAMRSLVLLNGFATVDTQLTAILHSTENVFQCLPPDRPELPLNFFARFLFSEEYLKRVGKTLALNLLTAITNPISMAGRLLLLKGALHHVNMTASGKTDAKSLLGSIHVPLILVHSTENALVPPSQVSVYLEGRSVDQVYAHQQTSRDSITAGSKQLVRTVAGGGAASDRALVLWFKAGHVVQQEAKPQIIDLFRTLATIDDHAATAAAAAAAAAAAEEKNTRRSRKQEQKQKQKQQPMAVDDGDADGTAAARAATEAEYERTRREYKAQQRKDALLRGEPPPPMAKETKSTAGGRAAPKGAAKQQQQQQQQPVGADADPAKELQRRIEMRMQAFEADQRAGAQKRAVRAEEGKEALVEAATMRRQQWAQEDVARLGEMQSELQQRSEERDKEELERSARIAHYGGTAAAGPTPAESKTAAPEEEEKTPDADTGATPPGPGKVATSALSMFDELEKETKAAEAAARRRNQKAATEEEEKRAEYERVQSEMQLAEKERQLEFIRKKALEEEALREQMVVHIQKLARGIAGRRRAELIREEQEMEEVYAIAALRITSIARMHLAQMRVQHIQKEEERRRAAMIIAEDLQRIFRGVMGRKYVRNITQDRAARVVQRIGRGYIGRKKAKRERARQRQLHREREAAMKMQSLFRMHKGMLIYQTRLLEDIASISIQRAWRGVLGRRVARRKRQWQSAEPGPERLELGLKMVQQSRDRFETHRQEIEGLHREQEKTEARVSLIHAGLRESEKELATLERELQEIDQLDRDLKELTHEKELFDLEVRKDGAPAFSSADKDGDVVASTTSDKKRAADAYALEMAIHLKRGERERKKKELEAEFAGVFAEVQQKRTELQHLELAITDMEMSRQRKDREFQRLQRNMMELLEEQKEELDNIRAKGVELEVATATSAAAAAATAMSAKRHEEKSRAIFEGTEELMKFQFMSMSMNYFNSLNMMKSLRDMNADTTAAAIKSSADTAAAAAAASAAANIPSMKHMQLGADDLVSAMKTKREFAMAEKRQELQDAKKAMEREFPDDIHEWTCADVQRWLDMLMLGQYKKAFSEAAVDGNFLMELTAEDMRDILGMEHRLHVKKILAMREKLIPLTADELRMRNELKEEEAAAKKRMGDPVDESATATPAQVFMHARSGRKRRVELAMNKGFDVNSEDSNGNHLLIVASQQVNVGMCEMLIKRGAKINHQNGNGNTALHYAMAYDPSGDVGEFLIANGADDMIENQWGLSPYDGISEE